VWVNANGNVYAVGETPASATTQRIVYSPTGTSSWTTALFAAGDDGTIVAGQ
jgi:hypothetical protein